MQLETWRFCARAQEEYTKEEKKKGNPSFSSTHTLNHACTDSLARVMSDTRTAQALLRGALLPPDVTPDKTTAYRSSDTTAEATIGNLQVWPARPRVRATTAVTAATASSYHAWHRPSLTPPSPTDQPHSGSVLC